MEASALQSAIAQPTTTDADANGAHVDVSSDLWEAFDGRLEDLHWREGRDGALLVADAARRPETMARIALEGVELVVNEVDPADHDWRNARTISSPDTAANPQFD